MQIEVGQHTDVLGKGGLRVGREIAPAHASSWQALPPREPSKNESVFARSAEHRGTAQDSGDGIGQ